VPLATETGQWLYFAPADVKRVEFTPVQAEQAEQPLTKQRSNHDYHYQSFSSPLHETDTYSVGVAPLGMVNREVF
jgi:hypothetical protein